MSKKTYTLQLEAIDIAGIVGALLMLESKKMPGSEDLRDTIGEIFLQTAAQGFGKKELLAECLKQSARVEKMRRAK